MMEYLYIVIPLHDENREAFSTELLELFPLFRQKVVSSSLYSVLVLSTDLEDESNNTLSYDLEIRELDQRIKMFSRKHSYLSIGIINRIGIQNTVFYDGYIMRNKNIVLEYANYTDGYIALLNFLIEKYDNRDIFCD